MRALTIGPALGEALLRRDMAVPRPGPGQLLVKVLFAGQNTTDPYVLDATASSSYRHPSHILGNDFLGLVVDGSREGLERVPRSAKVCGWVMGDTSVDGSYADFLVCDADMVVRVPDDGYDDMELAALPFCFSTALHALTTNLCLNVSPKQKMHGQPVLVWGAGTSCGAYAVQLLLLSGHEVLAVSGPDSEATLQRLGVNYIFPRSPIKETVENVRSQWPNLSHALDCFASSQSIDACIRCFGKDGGVLHALWPKDASVQQPANVAVSFDLVHCMHGKRVPILDMLQPAPSDAKLQRDRAMATQWFSYDRGALYRLLVEKRITLLPVTEWGVSPGSGSLQGLEGVQEALRMAAKGRLPSGKIVHRIASSKE